MARLSVNIDHVATIRQTRRAKAPDPVHAALQAELAGAHGIAVHLRGDRRHVQDRDVEILRKVSQSRLNLAMAAVQEMVRIALTVKPDQVTIVPERRDEITIEGGLDVILNSVQLKPIIRTLIGGGINVGFFIEPDLEQIKEAHRIGALSVEINTGSYVDANSARSKEETLNKIKDAARLGRKLGLSVHAGHGLDYLNVGRIASLTEIEELNIGHSIIARAVLVGMERAVREMLAEMHQCR
ncbi:MAG: pyridoxine 5'-phosphate synthase [Vicinamibacteria bacterium]|nr:pyridoxine 5'-phosphate synthase [Vicinamibacteria bacterium]